jgi:hypothetical protein
MNSLVGVILAAGMSNRSYKLTTVALALLLVWIVYKYWRLSAQVMTARFISNQARNLEWEIEAANSGVVAHVNTGAPRDRDMVLTRLNWYLDYYDHRTNEFAGSQVWGFVTTERKYVVRDAIAYLRKNSTNNFGDDPYMWIKHEFAR